MILGLSAFYHDSAAALVSSDGIVFAAAEERFSRRKHDNGFPGLAVRAALEHAGVALHELDAVVFADSPPRKLLRVVDTWLAEAPFGYPFFAASFRTWMGRRMFEGRTILRELRAIDPAFDRRRLRYARHHESHAASAFLPSPFERAAVLTVDGVGEWATTGLWLGEGDALTPLGELRHPHSLGLLYSAFTAACGFRVNSGEYELMGLAPYGEPELVDEILGEVVHPLEGGAFALDLRYFDFGRRERMTSDRFHERFGPPRDPGAPITDRERALAASIQVVLERLMLGLVEELHRRTGASDLCLAGGVALNGVANGRIAREGPFRRVWVQPAAGDDGGALGAALLGRRGALPRAAMRGALLGPSYDRDAVAHALDGAGLVGEELDPDTLAARCAALLDDGAVLGWFQDRMEFGPRALGARSILADPRDPGAKDRINARVKDRAAFRPFAPAVLAERAGDWFELDGDSPYMSLVVPVHADRRAAIPAVTHVDGSARVQTVDERTPDLRRLLRAFEARTSCPVLLLTSFNVRGEPIVQSPADAIGCFGRARLDALAIGPFLVRREA